MVTQAILRYLMMGVCLGACAMGCKTKGISNTHRVPVLSPFSQQPCGELQFSKSTDQSRRFIQARQEIRQPIQLHVGSELPSLGPWNAPLTMVLFSDFGCDDCMRGAFLVTAIQNLYCGKIRLVFRQFPISPESEQVAEASLAAHAQGKFWAFYDKVYGNPHEHDQKAMVRYAREIGLDVVRFERDLAEKRFVAAVQADRNLGRALNVSQVPALFLQGQPVAFPFGIDELSRLVENSRPVVKDRL